MTTEAAHIAEWESVLEREGLSPLDRSGLVSNGGNSTLDPRPDRVAARVGKKEAVDQYLTWARDVLETYNFDDRPAGPGGNNADPARERRIWGLYAEGKSVTEIRLELSLSRRAVTKTIARIMARSHPAPHVNPWLPSIPLRERAEQRRQQREEDMTPKRPQVEYSLIQLVRDVNIPGVQTAKAQLKPMRNHAGVVVPLMGTPHVGGIDVEVDTVTTRGGARLKTRTVITVPWWKIEQANQEPVEVEA